MIKLFEIKINGTYKMNIFRLNYLELENKIQFQREYLFKKNTLC